MKKTLSNFVPTRTRRYNTDKFGRTPLHEAVRQGDTTSFKELLANGDEVNTKDKFGNTPLHWAMRRSDTEMMQFLIANGAK